MVIKKIRKLILLSGIIVIFPLIALAQQADIGEETSIEGEVSPPYAVAGDDQEQLVGKKVSFDASRSVNPLDAEMNYQWDFGDGQFGEGKRVDHVYQSPSDYQVVLTVDNGQGEDSDELTVRIFEDLIILIADEAPNEDEIFSLQRYASRQRVLLIDVVNESAEPDYIVEGAMVDSLLERREDIKQSSAIITWTSGNLGLSVLSRFAQTVDDLSDFNMSSKAVVDIVDGSFAPVARFAQATFDVLKPQYILLTKQTALHSIIDAKKSGEIVKEIRDSGISHNLISFYSQRAVKDLGFTNFMSYSVNYLINKGVSTDNIILMLMLPIIAMIIAFARQFLGIKTFGIYTPTIITLSFLATGLKYGLAIFVIILVVATVARLILRKFRLLYLPRMAIVLTIVAFSILAMFLIGAVTDRVGLISLSILPILVLIILVEKFVAVQIEKGPRTAIILSLETILVSIACYWIASQDSLNTLILAYPEIVLVTFLVNILLGKWVGLRISEYIRFREIRRIKRQSKK